MVETISIMIRLLELGGDDMSMEELDWFSAYDIVTIEDGKIIRTLIVPKKKKEEESKNEKQQSDC